MIEPMELKSKNARRTPRAQLRQPLRIRPFDSHCPPEICTTVNLARHGIYFETSVGHYFVGMGIAVIRNFAPEDPIRQEEIGEVVRVEKLPNGRWGVAFRIFPLKSW